MDRTIPKFQPFHLKLFHTLLMILSQDPDANIASLLQEGIPSGAFAPLHPKNDPPDLQVCHDNWPSVSKDPAVTRSLI